jgi:hypothetical protein
MERIENAERDLCDHAKTISAYGDKINSLSKAVDELMLDRAVRTERDINLNGRLDRIETGLGNVYNLGKWLLIAICSAFVTAGVTFIINGGFSASH